MKKNVVLYSFAMILGVQSLFGIGKNIQEEENSLKIGTSFYIAKGEDVNVSCNLEIGNNVLFQNFGRLFFNSPFDYQINLPSLNLASSEFIFKGSKDCEITISGEGLLLGKLSVGMQGAGVFLNGNLVIQDSLKLMSGTINVSNESQLLIENTGTEAIRFNNSPINQGYVVGFLTRSILAGKSYVFPLGDATGYHPFLVDKADKADVLSVAFDSSVPDECDSYNPTPVRMIENSIGWRVESESIDRNQFFPGLSVYNSPLADKVAQLEIYYLSDLDLKGTITAGNRRNMLKSAMADDFVMSSEMKSYGLYAFSQVFGKDLVNFIYVGADNQTRFEVPSSGDFSNIRLNVYNRLGGLVFRGDHYGNEFDARDYPDGTYFYELTLEKDSKRSFIRNFIEIKHEK